RGVGHPEQIEDRAALPQDQQVIDEQPADQHGDAERHERRAGGPTAHRGRGRDRRENRCDRHGEPRAERDERGAPADAGGPPSASTTAASTAPSTVPTTARRHEPPLRGRLLTSAAPDATTSPTSANPATAAGTGDAAATGATPADPESRTSRAAEENRATAP